VIWWDGVLKRGLLPAAIAALLLSPAAAGAATTLVPGVTYDRLTRMIRGQPVVVHVVRSPRHGGLYQLRPVLSHNTVLGHQTVPSMQRGLRPWSTAVGVNGDFFNTASGSPSGAFLRDGVLSARPNPRRSAMAIAFDGRLLVERFRFAGWWKGGTNAAHPLREVNQVIDQPPGVSLFTRTYGAATPRVRGAVDLVLTGFPRALLNGWLSARVTAVRRNGGTRVPPGGAVLQARGFWRTTMRREAPIGSQVTVRLRMLGLPDDSADAIGGGPVLVRNGTPVRQADELFTLSQLVPRHPRTAVGQLADGRIILVVADGRSRRSLGLTNWDMARTMANLGAVTAMGFDGGGSTTLSFDGRVLNRPSDGKARAVANGLMLQYYGVYAPRLPRSLLTPNRDGVSDATVASAKIVRHSSVVLSLLRPNGSVAWRSSAVRSPGVVRRVVGAPGMTEGTWRWIAQATETQSGRVSRMQRRFVVNRTLGHLRLSKARMSVVTGRGGTLRFSVGLTRRSSLEVSVRSSSGRVVRVLFRGSLGPGRHAWRWGGRNASRNVVPSGTYTVRVVARNGLGTVALADAVRVVRVSR
jgi:hypothetical protein